MSGRKRTITWRPSYKDLKEAYVLRPGESCCRGVRGPKGSGHTKTRAEKITMFWAESRCDIGQLVPVWRSARITKAYKCRMIKSLCSRNSKT